MKAKFAEVYVAYPLDGTFTYRVPGHLNVQTGIRVKVNFANRNVTAVIDRLHDNKPLDYKVKDILDVVDAEKIFDDRLLDLAAFTAHSYVSTVGETLSLALPAGLRPSKRFKIPFESGDEQSVFLTSEQQRVHDEILEEYTQGNFAHLVYGVTGSGKTELYMQLAREYISKKQSVIFLVPEISLSSQLFERLYNVFGNDLIIYHSNLTANQRLYNWMRFYQGDASIVIGTRSAVFMQCPDLGLIIVDEEHDGSYKENSSPRYNAKRLAYYRCRKENALLVMGSATPAVESLYSCEQNVLKLHRLEQRFGDAVFPEIDIVKIDPGRPEKMISPILKLETKRNIDNGKQAIYLLNRRGFSPLVLCNECGWTVECPNCNISMNYHKNDNMLCHYCGLKGHVPHKCKECGSTDLRKIGSGTQRLEDIVDKSFPDVNIFRLDQDSSRKKDAVYNLIEKMNSGEIDILVGTQMVAKGFDFRNVTIVGVLLADIGLNLPDFRSSERIFSLLLQVAGRAGRREYPGKVIIQAINSEHSVFSFIKKQDYFGFYQSELEMRKMMDYPPFTRMARLLVRGFDEEKVKESVNSLKQALDENVKKVKASVVLLGPSSAPIPRIADKYRYHILIKSKDIDSIRKIIIESKNVVHGKDVYLEIDIDPYDIM